MSSSSRSGLALNSLEILNSSGNDSIVEVDASMFPYHAQDWRHRRHAEAVYYFDRRQNRIIEVMAINLSQLNSRSQSLGHSQGEGHPVTDSQSVIQFPTKQQRSLASRMMNFLGPCVRCSASDESISPEMKSRPKGLPIPEDEDTSLKKTNRR